MFKRNPTILSIAAQLVVAAAARAQVGPMSPGPGPRRQSAAQSSASRNGATAGLQASADGLQASALSAYTPPACVAGVPFADVTCTTPYDAWIEQFARDGITGGCGGGNYCPGTAVTRDQMAVFIERAMRGTGNWPPHVAFAWAVKDSTGAPDPTASGTALLNALNSIPASGNDAPSATNPWLLHVGPGIFDIGTAEPTLPAYVSMVGAGVDATIVEGGNATGPLIYVSGNGEVASLAVQCVGTSAYASGLWITGPTELNHVRSSASGGTVVNSAVIVGATGTSTLTDVELTGTGGTYARGLEFQNGTLAVRGGTFNGTGASTEGTGIETFAGVVQVFDAVVLSASYPVHSQGGTVLVAGSQLSGGSVLGTVTCLGNYFGSSFYASTCP